MKTLFDETKMGKITLKNRFIRAATWEELADEKGHLTDELIVVYENLAQNNVGTIITGYSFIIENQQTNYNMMGIYNDSFIDEYKTLTKAVHKYNANIILQIMNGGSQTEYKTKNDRTWGPSQIENISTKILSKEMTVEEIKVLIKAFADAALRAKKAGFDGVEIHGGHGYLLNQFLSPYYNRRKDEYGGSIENRARLLFQVYEAVRNAVGSRFPILVKMNCEDFIEQGLSLKDSKYVCKKLSQMGIDAIEISGGSSDSSAHNKNASRTGINTIEKESYFKIQATEIAEEVSVPIILVGGNRSLEEMNELLNKTKISYFSLCRPLLCEPNLIKRWYEGDTQKSKCISCNKCFDIKGKYCIFR